MKGKFKYDETRKLLRLTKLRIHSIKLWFNSEHRSENVRVYCELTLFYRKYAHIHEAWLHLSPD